jgi:phosphoribosylformylglycinamidine cyclo-ligase
VLPDGYGIRLEKAWPRPGVFAWLARAGDIDEVEMRRTFNLGIGFVVIVPPNEMAHSMEVLCANGSDPFVVGKVVRVAMDRPFEERVEWAS